MRDRVVRQIQSNRILLNGVLESPTLDHVVLVRLDLCLRRLEQLEQRVRDLERRRLS